METDEGLQALSPLDGRYKRQTAGLRTYFSEGALIVYRIRVEVTYLIALVEFLGVMNITAKEKRQLKSWSDHLTIGEVGRVKEIENSIKHDVKAVELFIGEQLVQWGMGRLQPWVHWGLTSEDTNSLAYGLLVHEATEQVYVPQVKSLLTMLLTKAQEWAGVAMPARTHGQMAVPTTVGKELVVFASRAAYLYGKLINLKQGGKLSGAVGNYNAQAWLYPDKDWVVFGQKVIRSLGLVPTPVTTQIEPGTRLVEWLSYLEQLNFIWLDFARDAWLYIALDYWQLKAVNQEVGSSTMPHKVNPIDFENAEGNLEMANGLIQKMMERLGQSRLQRDLSDSTVKRNLGAVLGHTMIALQSLTRGLLKIAPNQQKFQEELKEHPEMLTEALQLKLRAGGNPKAYEMIKQKVRGQRSSFTTLAKLWPEINEWRVDRYVGLAEALTLTEINRIRRVCSIPPL